MRPIGFVLRGSIALALFAISVAFVTSALAECAWVLWDDSTYQPYSLSGFPPGSREWVVIQAEPSMARCEAARASKIRDVANRPRPTWGTEKVEVTSNIVSITAYQAGGALSSLSTHRFLCLPDTIDPRGKIGE